MKTSTTTTLDAAQIAVTRGKNLIVSHGPGSGIGSATLSSISGITEKAVVYAGQHLYDALDLRLMDSTAEVIVFDDFDKAGPEAKEAIRSLLVRQPAEHIPAMPNLKSVVVIMTALGNWDEIDAAAQELAQLAPSVVVRIED